MEQDRARTLLDQERKRIEQLIGHARDDADADRAEADTGGEIADPAERLTAEQVDDALLERFLARREAIQRAEERLDAGTYGRSIRSGEPIPDERLEADPAAELTAEEAEQS